MCMPVYIAICVNLGASGLRMIKPFMFSLLVLQSPLPVPSLFLPCLPSVLIFPFLKCYVLLLPCLHTYCSLCLQHPPPCFYIILQASAWLLSPPVRCPHLFASWSLLSIPVGMIIILCIDWLFPVSLPRH